MPACAARVRRAVPDRIWHGDPELRAEAKAGRDKHRQAKANGNDATEAPTEPLAPIDPTSLAGVAVPPRRWLVPDWIPLARATALYGAGGEGKTLLAQMLATACALGAPWLGLPAHRCNSILDFCEDDLDEMHRRQESINAHFKCTFADLGAMRWLPRLGCDNALMTFDGRPRRTALFDQLMTIAKEHGAELVVTDTLADIFTGNEERSWPGADIRPTELGPAGSGDARRGAHPRPSVSRRNEQRLRRKRIYRMDRHIPITTLPLDARRRPRRTTRPRSAAVDAQEIKRCPPERNDRTTLARWRFRHRSVARRDPEHDRAAQL
jgi:AAA domain